MIPIVCLDHVWSTAGSVPAAFTIHATNAVDAINALDPRRVARAIERLLGRPLAMAPEWQATPIGSSLGVATGALVRLAGIAPLDRSEMVPWSLVVKVVRPPTSPRYAASARDPKHWAYWRREPLAYQSGLLERLPGGLAAPRCLLAEETEPEEVWLWLEDVPDAPGRTWPASRYLVAARHLGGFGGAYLGERPLPQEPWLAEEFFRKRIALAEQEHNLGLFWDRATWEHPLIAGRFSPDTPGRLRRLWDARAALLDALDRVPRTLRHGDAHRNNLRANDTPDPHHPDGTRYITVALDWAALSTGPAGADLTDLAIGVLLGPRGYPSPTLPDDLYAAYLGGLRAAGWHGDEAPVRLGYAATMALAGITRLHWAVSMALDAQRRSVLEEGGRSVDAALDAWANAASVCLRYGEEALGRL